MKDDTRGADLIAMARAMWPGDDIADVLLGLAMTLLPGRVVVLSDSADYPDAENIGLVALPVRAD